MMNKKELIKAIKRSINDDFSHANNVIEDMKKNNKKGIRSIDIENKKLLNLVFKTGHSEWAFPIDNKGIVETIQTSMKMDDFVYSQDTINYANKIFKSYELETIKCKPYNI